MTKFVKKRSIIARNRRDHRKNMARTALHHHEERDPNVGMGCSTGGGRKKYRLVRYDELPEYMKDNEYIIKYYRAEWPLIRAFLSLFQWHNETLNTWTHLLGFALFLGLTVGNVVSVPRVADVFGMLRPSSNGVGTNLSSGSKQIFLMQETMSSFPNANHTDIPTSPTVINLTSTATTQSNESMTPPPLHTLTPRWPFYVFLSGAMFCLLASTTCHLFSCHSYHLNTFLLRIDYVGITVMIITSFFPPISYIFQCTPIWQIVYLSAISFFGFCTVITLLSPTLSSGKYRAFRAFLFCSMGLFGLVPAVHACVLYWNHPLRNVTLGYESGMALSYLIGTGFYVSRVPERFKPGWFDLAGHSHQIFHVFVVLGALAHYGAGLVLLRGRDVMGCT